MGDAATTNSKFLDFSQLHPYFHLVKSLFTLLPSIFFLPKKEELFVWEKSTWGRVEKIFDGNFFVEITKKSEK